MQTLNALFGVAYDRTTLNPHPQLGNFWATYGREERRGRRLRDFAFAFLFKSVNVRPVGEAGF